MNLPRYSLYHDKVVWFFLAVMLAGGFYAFDRMEKKEDAPFVIKSAVVTVRYPGASPLEVEQLITEPIERQLQSMQGVWKITSESYYGLSKIMVELDPATPARRMPQRWDELRRKVLDMEELPEGASAIRVADDFGDVYGIYYGLSADEGFDYEELRETAQRIKRDVVTVEGVQKVTLFGEQTPVVNVLVSLPTLANFGVTPQNIIETMGQQNSVVSSGRQRAGQMEIRIIEEGTYRSLEDIRDQLLFTAEGKQVRLGDIAAVERGYVEPPASLLRINGRRGIGIGISTAPGYDVVSAGRAVERELAEITGQMPVGMELTTLYPENRIAREANNVFIVNLLESVAIVIAVIMAVMGLRSGVLVGSSLVFSIGGTLLLMNFAGEGLNRTSLAGFIIAMGMLVDNAIVVTDNAAKLIRSGVPRRQALIDGAVEPQWGLLGATFIAICSFLPLYLAPSSVAEIVKPLFVVVAVSLLLSWVLALTQTPLWGQFVLREGVPHAKDPYDNRFYRGFEAVLRGLLRHRVLTVTVSMLLFAVSLAVMGLMPQNFFPSMDKPYFRADCFLPDGYNIRDMERVTGELEGWLRAQPAVVNVSTAMGSSPPRYYLASSSFGPRPNFANLLVELSDRDSTKAVEARFDRYARAEFPDLWVRSSLFKLSPAVEASIEIGFIGDDIDTLLSLCSRAQAVFDADPGAVNVRNSWGNRVPTWTPVYSQVKGQRIGVSRASMAREINIATDGYPLGVYRRQDQSMPILLKDNNVGGYNLNNLRTVPLFSRSGRVYPLEQAVEDFDFDYRFNVVKRYNRTRVMKVQCDPARGVNTAELLRRLTAAVEERVSLPEGYRMKLFGEQESQQESNRALAANMPLTVVLIFITLLLLFNGYKKPLVILLMVPLIFIGVVLGLVVSGKMFDFFALLGLLGLVGMNIKNSVVLVAQIERRQRENEENGEEDRTGALVDATRSRIVPVAMASGTTILGMAPLLFDSMFGGMAATIMGGLFVATFLVIFVLPVTYALFFNIKAKKR